VPETKPQAKRRADVLSQVRRHPNGITARDVSAKVGIHYTTANDDLHILANRGLVQVVDSNAIPRIWKKVLTD
jgi:predicted ArsR family transcriptional regulator